MIKWHLWPSVMVSSGYVVGRYFLDLKSMMIAWKGNSMSISFDSWAIGLLFLALVTWSFVLFAVGRETGIIETRKSARDLWLRGDVDKDKVIR